MNDSNDNARPKEGTRPDADDQEPTVTFEALTPATPEEPGPPPSAGRRPVDADDYPRAGDGATAPAGGRSVATRAGSSSRHRNPWLWVGALALVLAVAVGWVLWSRAQQAEAREAAVTSAVTAYFDALRAGDADAALSYAASPPTERGLLTDGVLAASQKAAPLADLQVTDVTVDERARQAVATASYRLGEAPVRTQLALSDRGGDWKLMDVTSELSVSPVRGILVNGAVVTQEINPVFPGTYSASSRTDLLTATATPVTISDPSAGVGRLEATLSLNTTGLDAAIAAAKKALEACFATGSSAPKDCPWVIRGAVEPGTLTYRLVNDPWAGFRPAYDGAAATATGSVTLGIRASGKTRLQGQFTDTRTRFDVKTPVTVDFTAPAPTARWTDR